MGLPKVLEDMIQAALESSPLNSWNIYQERNGAIIFKLRFSGHDQPPMHFMPTGYKKKTVKQTERDYTRSRAWQDKRQNSMSTGVHPRETATEQNICDGIQTRSMKKADEGPEVARAPESSSPLNVFADSFTMSDVLISPHTPSPSITQLTPEAFVSQVLSASSLRYHEQGDRNEPTAAPEASPVLPPLDTDGNSVCSSSTVTDEEDISHWCQHDNCSYCDTRGPDADVVYKCPKCHLKICSECVHFGNHDRHKKYFVIT